MAIGKGKCQMSNVKCCPGPGRVTEGSRGVDDPRLMSVVFSDPGGIAGSSLFKSECPLIPATPSGSSFIRLNCFRGSSTPRLRSATPCRGRSGPANWKLRQFDSRRIAAGPPWSVCLSPLHEPGLQSANFRDSSMR